MRNNERHENRKKEQYFIDTNGKCHKFKGNAEDVVSIHYQIAIKLYPDTRRPDDILMNLGWILMGSSVYSAPIIHKEPTQSQINKLDSLGEFRRLTILKDGFYVLYSKL